MTFRWHELVLLQTWRDKNDRCGVDHWILWKWPRWLMNKARTGWSQNTSILRSAIHICMKSITLTNT
jgi:hypothetical protein